MGRAQYGKLTWEQLHNQCSRGGYRRRESKGVLKALLASTDAAEAKRTSEGDDDTDTSETINGERKRATSGGVMDSGIPTQSWGKKCLVGDLHLAFVPDMEVVKKHVQCM